MHSDFPNTLFIGVEQSCKLITNWIGRGTKYPITDREALKKTAEKNVRIADVSPGCSYVIQLTVHYGDRTASTTCPRSFSVVAENLFLCHNPLSTT
jgi:hypothetical protein